MSNMPRNGDFSKKIIGTLAQKKAVSVQALNTGSGSTKYAITRSIKNLADMGLIETFKGGQGEYLRLTKQGRMKANSQKLDARNSLVSPNWDGKWRIVLLDLPESRKAERESLRYLLKKAGFVCLKNSAWVSPYPFEHLFGNIKKDMGLTTELMIIVTEQIDEETKKYLLENF
jgi:DNA-binding transcriptional regulator PaaX